MVAGATYLCGFSNPLPNLPKLKGTSYVSSELSSIADLLVADRELVSYVAIVDATARFG